MAEEIISVQAFKAEKVPEKEWDNTTSFYRWPYREQYRMDGYVYVVRDEKMPYPEY